MPVRTLGKKLCLALAFLLSGCRNDPPPKIDICQGDGFGGADCTLKDGSHVYKKPSDLLNAWITNQADAAAFTSWCYQTTTSNAQRHLDAISTSLRSTP